MGVGFALYGLANFYQWMSNDPIIKHTIKCPYCRKSISEKVTWPFFAVFQVSLLTLVGSPVHQLHELARWPRGQAQPRLRVLVLDARQQSVIVGISLAFPDFVGICTRSMV